MRTEWFSIATPPVRPGYYECAYDTEATMYTVVRYYWTGDRWRYSKTDRDFCLFNHRNNYSSWDRQWRGLTRGAYLKAGGK